MAATLPTIQTPRLVQVHDAEVKMAKGENKNKSTEGTLPVLVAAVANTNPVAAAAAAEEEDYDNECAICMDAFNDPVLLSCGHTYCRGCLQGMRQHTCPTCRADLPKEFAEHAAQLVVDDARKQLEAERQMIIDAMGGAVKGCPACGNLIEKVDGDHQVMCGCEAKPAGGTMTKALAGGGCGHCWDFRNGNALEYGKPGQPYNERQVYYHSNDTSGGGGGGSGGGGGHICNRQKQKKKPEKKTIGMMGLRGWR